MSIGDGGSLENAGRGIGLGTNGLIESATLEPQRRKSWERSFTNPLRHRDNRFCYIVYGILGREARELQTRYLQDAPQFDPSQAIDLLNAPNSISERKKVLASIIDQDHLATWGERGLILSVPFDNVLAAYEDAVNLQFLDPEKAIRERKVIPTVQEILQATNPHAYNEIVLTGTTPAGIIQPIGVFTKVSREDGRFMDQQGATEIALIGRKYNLPYVEILS